MIYWDRFTSFCTGAVMMSLVCVAVIQMTKPLPCIETPPPSLPRIYGLECDGTSGPIFAYEEDDMPICKEIVEYDPD